MSGWGRLAFAAAAVLWAGCSVPSEDPIPNLPESDLMELSLNRSASPSPLPPTVAVTPSPTLVPAGGASERPWAINRVDMIDRSIGWAVAEADGAAGILRTIDGGVNWADVTPVGAPDAGLQAVFVDGEFAALAHASPPDGVEPSLWTTNNGGRGWTSSPMHWRGGGTAVLYFADRQTGWLMSSDYGGAGSTYFEFLRTRDAGNNWETLLSDAWANTQFSTAVRFNGPSNGLMVFGHDTYFITLPIARFTTDGGESWGEHMVLEAPNSQPDIYDSAFCGSFDPQLFTDQVARLAVICDDFYTGQTTGRFLYSTVDGGHSWQTAPYPGGHIQFITPELGWALGQEIHLTEDGGQSWTKLAELPWSGQFDFVDEQYGWAVGRQDGAADMSPRLYQTSDSGRTWSEIEFSIGP